MYVCVCMYVCFLLQTAVDTLLMRFTTSIHDSAYAVVADYAKVSVSGCGYKYVWLAVVVWMQE